MEYEIEEDEAVSTAVVRAVSAVDGRDPCSIPLLGGVVDPDALDRLFASSFTGKQRNGGRLRFVYDHCHVTIDDGEYLTVEPLVNHPQILGDHAEAESDVR